MSVGGKVCDIARDVYRVWINTDDGSCKCAIYVKRDHNSENVTRGDVVWWQGRKAFWTTKDRTSQIETVLHRIGYSHKGNPRHLKVVRQQKNGPDPIERDRYE